MEKKVLVDPMVRLVKPEIEELIKNQDWKPLKEAISNLYASDIANLFREIDVKDCAVILRMLSPELQSEVFAELDRDLQEQILRNLTDEYVKLIIENLDPDDRTELFEELSPKLTRKLLNLLSPEERKESLALLGYPENSVGRLMTPDYVVVKPYWTVSRAMKHIRKFGKDAETIDVVYVIDDKWHLLDDLPIRKLILAQPKDIIQSLMDHRCISINVDSDQEEAVKLVEKYNIVALPVVDSGGHLLGIVTVDDVIDVMREEQTEDFAKFSAIKTEPVDWDFLTHIKETPLKRIFQARIGWLLTLLIMDLVTGGIIQSFEDTIAKYVVLVTFLPVLVDTAGNAGSQSATLVIRALALGTVEMKDWFYLLCREVLLSGLLGLVMGLGISIMGFVRSGSLLITQVVVLSMVVNVVIGSLIGLSLPFIFTRFKKDPATASTPLITTLADIVGTAIYLGIAYLMLS